MFRYSGGISDTFNGLDNPGTFYFRIFFYFRDNDDKDWMNGGLLSTSIDTTLMNNNIEPYDVATAQDHTVANSALNYLLINNEYERAELLLQFISLLSSININSPWYFNKIGGLGDAIDRSYISDQAIAIPAERKMLAINCLTDSMDMRIGTLLDLYRSICYSHTLKKDIVPANLRKFDMGVYIFSSPMQFINRSVGNISQALKEGDNLLTDTDKMSYAVFDDPNSLMSQTKLKESSPYRVSAKYFEFHNCEIDPNSSKSAFNDISNSEGAGAEYTIGIRYDDCYERRFNEFIMREIGDFIINDIKPRHLQKQETLKQAIQGPIDAINLKPTETVSSNTTIHQQQLNARYGLHKSTGKTHNSNEVHTNMYTGLPVSTGEGGIIANLLSNQMQGVVGALTNTLNDKLNTIMLGNIYTGTGVNNWLTDAERMVRGITSGGAVQSAIERRLR